MKIQLDTDARTITLEEEVKLGEFFSIIEQLMPDGEWKFFKFKMAQIVITANNTPIVIEKYAPSIQYPDPIPYQYPWYTTTGESTISNTTNNVTSKLVKGTYTIDYQIK